MKTILFVVLMLIITMTHAIELPEMSFVNEKVFMERVLLEKTTIEDFIKTYGQPIMRVEGMGNNREILTYFKALNPITYNFYFEHGKLDKVISKRTGFYWKDKIHTVRESKQKMINHPNRNWRRRWIVDLSARTVTHRPTGFIMEFKKSMKDNKWHSKPQNLEALDSYNFTEQVRLLEEAQKIYNEQLQRSKNGG